jgi:hypothetical protein
MSKRTMNETRLPNEPQTAGLKKLARLNEQSKKSLQYIQIIEHKDSCDASDPPLKRYMRETHSSSRAKRLSMSRIASRKQLSSQSSNVSQVGLNSTRNSIVPLSSINRKAKQRNCLESYQSLTCEETLGDIKYNDLKIEEKGDPLIVPTPYSVPTLSKVIENNQLNRTRINTPTLTEEESNLSIYKKVLL